MLKKTISLIFMVILMATFVSAECPSGMVSYWTFDDADISGDTVYDTFGNNDGTNSGATTGVTGQVGEAFYFNGVNSFVVVLDDDSLDLTDNYTIGLWAKWGGVGNYNFIITKKATSYLQASGYLWYRTVTLDDFYTNGYMRTNYEAPSGWNHYVGVLEDGVARVYYNGEFNNSKTLGVATANTDNLMFGRRAHGPSYAEGYMDEVAIFNRALSASEISDLYDWGVAGNGYCEEPEPPAPFSCGDTVSYEGQNYNTVLIGEQCWFAENLNVGTKMDDSIDHTNNAVIEKYCYNNDENICTTDGGFYQWDEVMNYSTTAGAKGICPTGWHIPTDDEWHTLENGLATGTCDSTRDGAFDCDPAGTALKENGSSGFEALMTGYRWYTGTFRNSDADTYFWSSLESGSTALARLFSSGESETQRYSGMKTFGFSVRCLYNEDVTATTTPTTSNFTSEETTNFSEVADITNVTSLTLAVTGKGKIEFGEDYEMNCGNQDYDTHVKIEDEFISVNTAALDESFNTSATITLEGVTCPVETITYQEGTFTSKDDIIAGGKNCELDGVCSNIQCTRTTLTFDVAHFTGFAAGADANLTTQAEAGVFYPLDPIEFTAEYINSTDGTPISGECNITFDDDWDTEYIMDFDTDYNYTKSFAASGTHKYNVTCSSVNFVTLEANDTKLVSSVDIPEFSIMTLGLGLVAVLIGLFIIRRKK